MEDIVLKGKRLLVVDDEVDLREIVASELEFMGAIVTQADNIFAAQKILDEQSIDLVISDIRMPGGTGIDLLKTIRSKTASHPPVILITGFADITVEEAFNMGAEALMNKPFRLEDLLKKADKLTSPIPARWKRQDEKKKNLLKLSFPQSLMETKESHMLDLGRGGFTLLSHSEGFENHQLLDFELQFKDLTLKGEGQVKWIKSHEGSNNLMVGIQFTWLDDETYSLLSNQSTFTSVIPWIPVL